MAHEQVVGILNEMSPDDRTALLEELPSAAARQLIRLLTPEERHVATALLGYPEDSVGRLMTPDFIQVKEDWTVQHVLDYVREYGRDSETLTATAMQGYNSEIEKAAILALFLPLIISSGGNSGSQATTLVIRAMALGELRLRDWFRVVRKELLSGVSLGLILGTIGFFRITLWQYLHIFDYGKYHWLVALTVGAALV